MAFLDSWLTTITSIYIEDKAEARALAGQEGCKWLQEGVFKVQLSRDLRKSILRGHPWVYREALAATEKRNSAALCEVLDKKGKALAWAIYCPEGALALRIISTEKKPPNQKLYEARLRGALSLRNALINGETNCYRLVNGEGDGLPGFVCDVYGDLAVIQFDGHQCYEFWDQDWLANWLLKNLPIKGVYFKPRRSDGLSEKYWGEQPTTPLVRVKEQGCLFWVNYVEGQKTGFFLDQRENRHHLRKVSRGKRILNLFSYTGGFSIYAGQAGAQHVTSVDLAAPALELAKRSWLENGLDPETHEAVTADVFEFVTKQQSTWDVVVVDPPSMTHSEKNKEQALKRYIELFAQSARLVSSDQHLLVSSCSSHLTFQDFFDIIDESMSQARRKAKILRVSGQGGDHPFPHYCHELRYLKFVHLQLD